MVHVVLAEPLWYGPAVATFAVQFPGDPYDAKRNDVRVRFVGDRDQREERPAYFDPALGAWRATLFAPKDGRYRAVLVRNGKDLALDPSEGILDLLPARDLGFLNGKSRRANRLARDTGAAWTGLGADVGDAATPADIDRLADAGATWVRVGPPADPLAYDALVGFGAAMDAVARRGLDYTLAVPATSTAAWRRYVLARFAPSPRLVGWEGGIEDPQGRATAPSAEPWEALFEDRPGPFVVPTTDLARLRALKKVLEISGWVDWDASRAWTGRNAKGVAESDRLILLARPGARLVGLPLADGTYDLTTLDPAAGDAQAGQARLLHGSLDLSVPAERFFVLRRRL